MLGAGAVTIVFPGGDYDSFRPTRKQGEIDFNGRTGYIRTALAADVPIVPVVSIGGQESQLFLWHGEPLAKLFGLQKLCGRSTSRSASGSPSGSPSRSRPTSRCRQRS